MNPNEQKLQYPWGDQQPEPGHALEVAPGVKWIRMPLPFALDHINLWLLRDEQDGRQGWTIVDCGISRNEVKELWQQVFERELDGLPVLRVLVTHMHPDHMGLADWLCQRWQAPLWISMTDFMVASLWSGRGNSAAGGEGAVAHFARHGLVDLEAQEQIRQRSGYYPNLVPSVPASYRRVMDGDMIRIGAHVWRAISGYGHAPEHMAFFCADLNVLISGDMVLPRISTNVSVFDYEPEANPLPLYLRSLNAYGDLPQDTLVLPAHGRPFRGLHERIAQQHSHHADRLDEVMQACREAPCSAADIVPVLFRRKLDLHQLTFAMGEALAHLHALYFEGRLARQADPDGVLRFRAC
ncbi:MBL fold metallo-hydrolase [Bordetella trematum]|uniref:MBL fold metallo-hydrolase n=1 Tax=Bordetella trematum TaxID=123899 RepID=UPI0014044D57|nr:MBL fold metallo-hydrolase [Bordetella trematum]QIM70821.1 MBL fold metallo-hydrolase [Bordetella trematum]